MLKYNNTPKEGKRMDETRKKIAKLREELSKIEIEEKHLISKEEKNHADWYRLRWLTTEKERKKEEIEELKGII